MKIACITDDQTTISQHFGRAAYYAVLTVEDGQIIKREIRAKMGHPRQAGGEHSGETGLGHGQDSASHNLHVSMADVIADCQVLLCRGMGRGAYESMTSVGIIPVVTDESDIDAAALAYSQGSLVDHPERLH